MFVKENPDREKKKRSFSLLRLIKSYLRATTSQGGLNNLMILSAYKENDDQLNLNDVAREFYPQKRHKNIIWEDINVLTHFFLMLSLRFKIFKPYNFCSSKHGQYNGNITFLTS